MAYCIPSSVTLIHEDRERVVTIRYTNKRAYVVAHNVTEERHVRDLLIWYLSHLDIKYCKLKEQCAKDLHHSHTHSHLQGAECGSDRGHLQKVTPVLLPQWDRAQHLFH